MSKYHFFLVVLEGHALLSRSRVGLFLSTLLVKFTTSDALISNHNRALSWLSDQVGRGCNRLLYYNTTKEDLLGWTFGSHKLDIGASFSTKDIHISDYHTVNNFDQQAHEEKCHFFFKWTCKLTLVAMQAVDYQSRYGVCTYAFTLLICVRYLLTVGYQCPSVCFQMNLYGHSQFFIISDDLWLWPRSYWRFRWPEVNFS